MDQAAGDVNEVGGRVSWESPLRQSDRRAKAAHKPRAAGVRAVPHTLTPRLRSVARAVALGMTNKEIAETLCIAESSVKSNHMTEIFRRWHVTSRLQVALRYRAEFGKPGSDSLAGVFE